MSNNKRIFFIILLILLDVFSGCGGQGTTIVGNPTASGSSSIAISQLENGQVTVTIPESLFETASAAVRRWTTGSSSPVNAVSGATIDVEVNGILTYEGISAEDNYQESAASVVFILTSLEDGDRLNFIISTADGSVTTFSGTASASQAGEATDSDAVDASGSEAFSERDLSAAANAYCDAYDAGNAESRVAFGCYLATVLTLPETVESQALLNAIGAAEIDVTEDILGDVVDQFTGADPLAEFHYSDFDLPLAEILSAGTFAGDMAELVAALNATGTSAAELQDELVALRDDFEALDGMLDIVVEDADFSYSVPAGLFGTEEDLSVDADQVKFHRAGVNGVIVGLDVIDAYDFGADLSVIVNEDGTDFDYEILVADLNGTGETVNGVTVDTTPFLTLENAALVTDSEERVREALEDLSDAFATLGADEHFEVFGSAAAGITAEEAADVIGDLLASLDGDTLTPLAGTGVSLNLKAFFDDPPSAADVTDSDPFVFEDGTIRLVESYFRDLLDGKAEF